MGTTRKPCPGCGDTSGHETGRVCGSCQAKLRAYDDLRAAEQASSVLVIPGVPHIPDGGLWHRVKNAQPGEFDLSNHVRSLVELLGRPVQGREPNVGSMNDSVPLISYKDKAGRIRKSEHRERWYVPKGLPEILSRIFRTVAYISDARYQEGRRDGADLLGRLASGDLTLAEINEKVLGVGGHED